MYKKGDCEFLLNEGIWQSPLLFAILFAYL